MRMFCRFIGLVIGMLLGLMVMNSVPFLAITLIIGGMLLGGYIGGRIKANQQRIKEECEYQKQLKYAEKLQKKDEVQSLVRKYPEATKYYFYKHWGIKKTVVTDYDITDDKIETLLGHRDSYEKDEHDCKAKLEAERAERIKRETAKREAERQAEIAKKQAENQIKKSLPSKVSCWNVLNGNFHYNYLLNYYPTSCDFEVGEAEWNDRWTVWNFKNTPGKTTPARHKRALDTVIPQIKSKLVSTFGMSSLEHLTLVCIPASSAEKTQARYEEFSQRLCRETGMINAYEHMWVIASCQEKKFGGSGISTNAVSFDNSFFRGKYVLLFDDVITKGESMLKFKRKMEELGAIVIGGFSIGKTTHSYNKNHGSFYISDEELEKYLREADEEED